MQSLLVKRLPVNTLSVERFSVKPRAVMRWLHLPLWCLFALLAGCSQQTAENRYNDAVWRGQRESLEKLTHWQLRGKLAILTAKEKGSARLNWQQRGDDYDLVLTNVLGGTLLEVHQLNGRVEVVDRDGRHYQSQDSEALIYQLTGWPIPMRDLPTWIKGLPGQASFELGGDGRVNRLKQDNWALTYQDYARTRLWLLPTAIELQGPQTRIKLAINEWQIDQ